jgi:hypothetical protein
MKTLRRSPRLRSSFEQRQPQLRVPAPPQRAVHIHIRRCAPRKALPRCSALGSHRQLILGIRLPLVG